MKHALIISDSPKSIVYLTNIFNMASFDRITSVPTAGQARRLFVENSYDLCIINSPLPDENGIQLAQYISSKMISQVILIVKTEIFDEISAKVENSGVITVAKPVNQAFLWNAIKLSDATITKMQLVQQEKNKLLQRIEDIKIVDRAKCLLISYLSMSEEQAHRYIEKQAMNQRITKRAVADGIIKTYEY